ncbi:MAG TPA: SPOR domain-containing protein [Ignavibacteria bacterium]
MKNLLYTFLYIIIFLLSGFSIYSCGCDCYEDENLIKVDTIRKQITVSDTGPFVVQIGAFLNKDNANNFAAIARSKLNTSVVVRFLSDDIYRVIAGDTFDNINQAEELLDIVKKGGYIDAIIRDNAGPIRKSDY